MGFMPLDDAGISVSMLFQQCRSTGCQRHSIQHYESTNILEGHLPLFYLTKYLERS
jgi:hypothetical protein